MPFDSDPPPPAIIHSEAPGFSMYGIRNGTPEAAAFGRLLKAAADADNAERMARQARREAIGDEAQQVAELKVELVRIAAQKAAWRGRTAEERKAELLKTCFQIAGLPGLAVR
jgi:hypothetical protein